MIKVLLTGPPTRVFSGGIQTFLLNTLDAFQQHPSIRVTSFESTQALLDRESWLGKFWRNVWQIVPFIRAARDCDIIHLNSTFDNRSVVRDAFYGSIALFILRKKLVFHFHGKRASDVRIFQQPLPRAFLKLFFRRVHLILILSELQRREFQYVFSDLEQVWTIPNFIRLEQNVSPDKSGRTPVFLFLARLIEAKGVKEILYAARDLKASGLSFRIIFCGDGALRDWLNEHISIYELQDCVEYRGLVTGAEKEEFLRQADVMLLPTRYREGFPFTLLEAFNYALPVIASPEGAIPEIIRDGENGFLVDSLDHRQLAEGMRICIENPELRQRMGEKARRMVEERFSIVSMIETFSEMYESLRKYD